MKAPHEALADRLQGLVPISIRQRPNQYLEPLSVALRHLFYGAANRLYGGDGSVDTSEVRSVHLIINYRQAL
jgi:hypothetical protein